MGQAGKRIGRGLMALLALPWPALAAAPAAAAAAPSLVCEVRRFGAVGDGRRLDTRAIQAAVDACAARGGGTVHFAAGTYRSGSVRLASRITVDLDRGARLLGSGDVGDYASVGRVSEERSTALLWAIGAHDVRITGAGTIDGNGRAFVDTGHVHNTGGYDPAATRQGSAAFARYAANRAGPVAMRPRPGVLVLLIDCDGVALRGVRVRDAPNWCIHLACCRHVRVDGIDVRNSLLIPNADAIDVSNCQDVAIADVYLEAGDDGIAISPCADGFCRQPARDIHVRNAVIVSRSAGIRLGWAAEDIRDVSFDHVTIRSSNRGVGIFVRGNETIADVRFADLVIATGIIDGDWWGMGEPVHVSVLPWQLTGAQGSVADLRFDRVTTTADAPIVLFADQPGQIRDVVFDHLTTRVVAGPLTARYGGNLDLRPAEPVARGIARFDSAAIVATNVDALTLRDTTVDWMAAAPDFFRAGLAATKVRGLTIARFAGAGPSADTPAIALDHVADLTISDATATRGPLLTEHDVTRR